MYIVRTKVLTYLPKTVDLDWNIPTNYVIYPKLKNLCQTPFDRKVELVATNCSAIYLHWLGLIPYALSNIKVLKFAKNSIHWKLFDAS